MNLLSKFSCSDCNAGFKRKDYLVRHFNQLRCPALKIRKYGNENRNRKFSHLSTLYFDNRDEFFLWKDEEQQRTCSVFSQDTHSWKTKSGSKTKYLCHRGGYVRLKEPSKRRRSVKRKGSCKINNHCTAYILCEEVNDGKIVVKYNKKHCNHDTEMKHLTLSSVDKTKIAGKLDDGVPMNPILDDIRRSAVRDSNQNTLTGVTRTQLITKKELHNIKSEFNISYKEQECLSSFDTVSVRALIEEHSKTEISPFLFYKEQGVEVENNEFEKGDVLLVMMDGVQKDFMKKYGTDKICIDSTHCTTSYQFILTTIMVVDDFDMGVPVAHMISNKENTSFIKKFFEVVKEACGVIKATTFMSDDFSAYYTAWKEVMGPCDHNLLCIWHVDRNWRKNLSLIKNIEGSMPAAELKKQVYKSVRTVMEQTLEHLFPDVVDNLVQKLELDPATKAYGVYFKEHYSQRYKMWSFAFRKHVGINTNMKLEALHHELKHVYFNGVKNKRMDYLVATLLKMNRDKSFKRMSNLVMETDTHTLKRVRDRHKEGMRIPSEDVSLTCGEVAAYVRSQSNHTEYYSITKSKDNCDCKLRCTECDSICVHQYSCTCVDNTISVNFCKHIHAFLKVLLNSEEFASPDSNDSIPCNSNYEEVHGILNNMQLQSIDKVQCESNTERSKSIKSLSQQLVLGAENCLEDDEIDEKIVQLLKQAVQLMKMKEKRATLLKKKTHSPHNKRSIPQLRFKSTRKKKSTANSIKKPTFNQKLEMLSVIGGSPDPVINVINDDFDHLYHVN